MDRHRCAGFSLPFAYSGRILVNSNIYYNHDRYYDSANGRFISEDPLGLVAGNNLYSYANGDPLSVTGPTGNSGVGDVIDVGVGTLAGVGFAVLDKENCLADLGFGALTGLDSAALTAGTVGLAVALAPEAAALTTAIVADAVAGAVFGTAADYANQLFHQLLTGGDPTDINIGELVGSGVGGFFGGGFGGLLGEPLEAGLGKVFGSVVRNANTLPFGFEGMIGKGHSEP